MQGIVLELDLKSDAGLIRGDDGFRYGFKAEACKNGVPLEGSRVDFEILNAEADALYVISTPMKAKLDWLFWFLFSFRGRISRDQLIAFLGLSLMLLPLPVICAAVAGTTSLSVGGILAFFVFSAVLTKRFHDSNASVFWYVMTLIFMSVNGLIYAGVIAFVPAFMIYTLAGLQVLAALFCLYLALAKGTMGQNRYGKEPYYSRTVRLK